MAALATNEQPLIDAVELEGPPAAKQQEPTMMSREARAYFLAGDSNAGLMKWKVGSASTNCDCFSEHELPASSQVVLFWL